MDYLAILKNRDSSPESDLLKVSEKTSDRALAAKSYCEKSEISEKSPLHPAACGPECYEIEPGKRIHRPWAGCRTKIERPVLRQIPAKCWHCGGGGRCGCISCAERLAAGERGECLLCGGSGKVAAWVQ